MTTEITLKKALQDCIESLRRLDDKEGAYRQTCIKQAEQAIINARPSRIVVSVSGGIAEIADAENWPQDLELYFVDYDVDDSDVDSDSITNLNGPCILSRLHADDVHMEHYTGEFSMKCADAWEKCE